MPKIFVVEDDPVYAKMLEYHLTLNPDNEVLHFGTAKDCLNALPQQPDIITIDYSLPDMSGSQLFQKIRKANNQIPVVIISGQDDMKVAIDMLKAGAVDYIIKDENTKDLLWNSINRVNQMAKMENEIIALKEEVAVKYTSESLIIGQCEQVQQLHRLIHKAAQTNINVSISGETGTGKELVAKSIHYASAEKKKPFIPVNIAAIPSELIESELFGHEKGAFTGAATRKKGKFEEANGGTLFLDEIAEADLSIQSKLLRVLQERELTRVGGNEVISLDFRLITATHKDLVQEVRSGNFREDLYYRIYGFPIHVPTLRERGHDIILLTNHFIKLFCESNKMQIPVLDKAAKDTLMNYHFPGNIRQLKSMVEMAVVMSDGKMIQKDDIRLNAVEPVTILYEEEKTLKQYMYDIIFSYLKKYENDVQKTSEVLDIGKSTIYKYLKEVQSNETLYPE